MLEMDIAEVAGESELFEVEQTETALAVRTDLLSENSKFTRIDSYMHWAIGLHSMFTFCVVCAYANVLTIVNCAWAPRQLKPSNFRRTCIHVPYG